MIETPEGIKKVSLITIPAKPRQPREVRITLSVCGCYRDDKLTLITEQANSIVSILGITLRQLEYFAVTAMLTGKAQVVACYKQSDVAEVKLAQLEARTPFISRPCHSFNIESAE